MSRNKRPISLMMHIALHFFFLLVLIIISKQINYNKQSTSQVKSIQQSWLIVCGVFGTSLYLSLFMFVDHEIIVNCFMAIVLLDRLTTLLNKL